MNIAENGIAHRSRALSVTIAQRAASLMKCVNCDD